jgi:hypothetical protein
MNLGRTVFAQLMDHLPSYEFQKCVARHGGDSHWRGFSCWDQFLAMSFAQLTYRESLRDIEACLRSMSGKLYHVGFRGRVARTTLADANESHDWRIYADFAQVLIRIARPLYAHDPIGVDIEESLYALDSTTIDLCLSLFPWARFRRHKAAVKMHTLLDLHGNIPTFIRITDGKVHDVNILDEILPEAGAFCVMDRGYIDFERMRQSNPSVQARGLMVKWKGERRAGGKERAPAEPGAGRAVGGRVRGERTEPGGVLSEARACPGDAGAVPETAAAGAG